jgi:hypothetical protein
MTDHIVEPTKMVCVHCGLPADRNQNGIQGYRCGSSYEPNFRPQWARSMTCLEIENKKLKERIDQLELVGQSILLQRVKRMDEDNEALRSDLLLWEAQKQ